MAVADDARIENAREKPGDPRPGRACLNGERPIRASGGLKARGAVSGDRVAIGDQVELAEERGGVPFFHKRL